AATTGSGAERARAASAAATRAILDACLEFKTGAEPGAVGRLANSGADGGAVTTGGCTAIGGATTTGGGITAAAGGSAGGATIAGAGVGAGAAAKTSVRAGGDAIEGTPLSR